MLTVDLVFADGTCDFAVCRRLEGRERDMDPRGPMPVANCSPAPALSCPSAFGDQFMPVPTFLQAIYDAYREKRLEDVLSSVDDEFRFIIHLPEELFPGGNRPRDRDETTQIMRHYMEAYDFLTYDPGPIIVTADKATAQPHVRLRHKKSGKILETKFRHLWHIQNGKVVVLEESFDLPVIEAFLKSVSEV